MNETREVEHRHYRIKLTAAENEQGKWVTRVEISARGSDMLPSILGPGHDTPAVALEEGMRFVKAWLDSTDFPRELYPERYESRPE
jgi:hypothetical protein